MVGCSRSLICSLDHHGTSFCGSLLLLGSRISASYIVCVTNLQIYVTGQILVDLSAASSLV